MAKVYGIHELELRPGVTGEEFERFFREQVPARGPSYEGWKVSLLQGNRGERDGKYALLFEIESVEARDRYIPAPSQLSPEAQQLQSDPSTQAVWEQWRSLATRPGEETMFTDYVVISE